MRKYFLKKFAKKWAEWEPERVFIQYIWDIIIQYIWDIIDILDILDIADIDISFLVLYFI